ncbi:MAG: GGDEF domain-containing protein, partial [Nannocystaceae bacterium]
KVDVLARYGGEEFSLILPEVETKGAAIFGEKIRAMIEQARFVFEGHHIPITISVGVAELTASIANADDLIRAADANLYRAKNGGRNCVVST